ncbi:MAG: hypothetical protein LQ350_003279 [Teloschistes chrysophthalmus]|nr:MAG: hypothetical protein LQ350_003279 [Niorma chrysophthalma]
MRKLNNRYQRKKEAVLRKSILDGEWSKFLLDDAAVTRAAFATWYTEVYLKSPLGQSIAPAVRSAILGVCDPNQCLLIERETQLPQTIEVFEAWEAIPMDPESREMCKARVRVIRDILLAGDIQKVHAQGLHATPHELEQARKWIHLESNGSLARYSSLRLPIMYRDLVYDPTTNQWYIITRGSEGILEEYEAAASQGLRYLEQVRISTRTLGHLMNGTYPFQRASPTPNELDTSQGAADPPAKWEFPIWSDDDDDEDQPAAGGARISTSGQEGAGNPEVGARRRTPDSDLSTEIGEEYYRGLDQFEGIPDRDGVEGERREEEGAGFVVDTTRIHPAMRSEGEEVETPAWVTDILAGREQSSLSGQKRKLEDVIGDDDHDTDRAPAATADRRHNTDPSDTPDTTDEYLDEPDRHNDKRPHFSDWRTRPWR